eukprot:CAMPEP_0198133014 /NCGR_PEP_ID=MMETSP1442-20131203/59339_1 /TAXON_ID= /ORGANISM="Craspedostauros australis, Strain CCMP3328" /LENGTH=869 /DNA_ID=CAMNT_0043794117 /DNA_START=238 /DNA_END=2850 /DNA_ORIENTATION=-
MDSSFPRSFDSQSDWLSRQCMRIDDPNDRWLMRLLKACNRNDLASVQALVESCEEGKYIHTRREDSTFLIPILVHRTATPVQASTQQQRADRCEYGSPSTQHGSLLPTTFRPTQRLAFAQAHAQAIDDPNDRWLVRLYKACDWNSLTLVQALVESCEEGTLCDVVHELRDTPLHRASYHGNMAIVKYLVESDRIKVDVNLQDRFGMTAIHRACENGRTAIVKYLMESDRVHVDFNIPDRDGNTPIHIASEHGYRDTIEYFMQSDRSDVDVNARNNKGQTLLHLACRSGKRDLVEYLMESDRIHFIMDDTDGNSLLHHACEKGQIDVLKYLVQCPQVDAAANINKQNNKGDTPLYAACQEMEISCVRYLVESDDISDNVNLNICNSDGDTLLHQACYTRRRGSEDMIAYLVQCDKIDTDNPPCLQQGHIDVLKYLVQCPQVDAAANINKQNNKGDTPLYTACRDVRTSCLRYLVESDDISDNVSLNIRNNNGDTLLHLACYTICVDVQDMIAYLVHCDKIDTANHMCTQNNDSNTPLHRLCFYGSRNFLPCLKLLLEEYQPNNANNEHNSNSKLSIDEIFKIQNRHGNTPLHVACKRQERDAIEYLLQASKTNGSFNIQNHDGDTPVHLAFHRGVFFPLGDATRLTHLFEFIQHQLIPTTNLSDLSHLNDRVGDTVITKRLIEEAKPIANIQNRAGNTLLHLACMNKDSEMSTLQQLVGHDSVDATLQNSDGDTPLHCICCADTDAGSDTGSIGEIYVYGHFCLEKIKLLIESSNVTVDVNMMNNGETPDAGSDTGSIGEIYVYGHFCLEKIKLLIESSNVTVDVNMMNNGGDTVLHSAVKIGLVTVVEYLMTLEEIDVFLCGTKLAIRH